MDGELRHSEIKDQPFPPSPPPHMKTRFEWKSEMLSGFSAPMEGRYFYKTCRELKVWCLYLREVVRQKKECEFWKALDADQKREFLPLLPQPISITI